MAGEPKMEPEWNKGEKDKGDLSEQVRQGVKFNKNLQLCPGFSHQNKRA